MAQQLYKGLGGRRGYTIGPALPLSGWRDIERLHGERMPVVVVADYLDCRMLSELALKHVLGIVIDRGSILDPTWDDLRLIAKPSIIGAHGAHAAARKGVTAIVDGVNGFCIVDPDDDVLARYRELKGSKPPPEPEHLGEALQALLEPIRQAWRQGGRSLPFDLPEQRELYRIAWYASVARLPTPEDDALVRRIILEDSQKERDRILEDGPL